jgi:serine/threonine protein kinase
MARVFRARDTKLGVDCAVKLLDVPEHLRDDLRSRLRSEAHAMALVQHPHVLRVLDVGSDGPADWIAMELAPGGSLEDQFEAGGPLPPRQAANWHADVLDALHAAHAAGVIHRDVKPSNLLLTADGRVLLADFGIARVVDDPAAQRSTRTGVTMGTMAYMAPEQRVDARGVGPAADQYAVAASLYWVVTGWNPIDLFAADLDSQRWDPVPEPLRAALFRATRYQPAERFTSAAEMARALRDALPALPAASPHARTPLAPRSATQVDHTPRPRPGTLVPTDPDAVTLAPAGSPPPRRWGPALLLLAAVDLRLPPRGRALPVGGPARGGRRPRPRAARPRRRPRARRRGRAGR